MVYTEIFYNDSKINIFWESLRALSALAKRINERISYASFVSMGNQFYHVQNIMSQVIVDFLFKVSFAISGSKLLVWCEMRSTFVKYRLDQTKTKDKMITLSLILPYLRSRNSLNVFFNLFEVLYIINCFEKYMCCEYIVCCEWVHGMIWI